MQLLNTRLPVFGSQRGIAAGCLLLICLVLSGCTSNGLIIRYFYGQIDNKLYDRIVAYATFTEQQKNEIRNAVDRYARWHRTSELPRYVSFIDVVIKQIQLNDVGTEIALEYVEEVRQFSSHGYANSPFPKSPQFLRDLSDGQVDEIEQRFVERDQQFLEWVESRQSPEGEKRRLKRLIKNISRFGVELNSEQQDILRKGLAELDGNPMQGYQLYKDWRWNFIEILHKRNHPEFIEMMSTHISVYQDLNKLANPMRHRHNQRVSANMISSVVSSLDSSQRGALIKRLRQTRETLVKISRT